MPCKWIWVNNYGCFSRELKMSVATAWSNLLLLSLFLYLFRSFTVLLLWHNTTHQNFAIWSQCQGGSESRRVCRHRCKVINEVLLSSAEKLFNLGNFRLQKVNFCSLVSVLGSFHRNKTAENSSAPTTNMRKQLLFLFVCFNPLDTVLSWFGKPYTDYSE